MISDEAWAVLGPLFPAVKATGRPPVDRRTVVEATAWRFRTGAPWRDLPELYLVRVEMPTPERPSGRAGNSRSGGTVASTEGPAPHGRGTRRPRGRPPHQDPGPRIAVRPPRTRTKTYFCRRTVS
ncbi:transposase [Streptomyces sp. NPDC054786]